MSQHPLLQLLIFQLLKNHLATRFTICTGYSSDLAEIPAQRRFSKITRRHFSKIGVPIDFGEVPAYEKCLRARLSPKANLGEIYIAFHVSNSPKSARS